MTRGDLRIFWRGSDASKQVDGDFTVRLVSVLRKARHTDRAIRRSVTLLPSINSQRPLKHPMLSPAGRFSRLPSDGFIVILQRIFQVAFGVEKASA